MSAATSHANASRYFGDDALQRLADSALSVAQRNIAAILEKAAAIAFSLRDAAKLSLPCRSVRAAGRRTRVVGAFAPKVTVHEHGHARAGEIEIDCHALTD